MIFYPVFLFLKLLFTHRTANLCHCRIVATSWHEALRPSSKHSTPSLHLCRNACCIYTLLDTSEQPSADQYSISCRTQIIAGSVHPGWLDSRFLANTRDAEQWGMCRDCQAKAPRMGSRAGKRVGHAAQSAAKHGQQRDVECISRLHRDYVWLNI